MEAKINQDLEPLAVEISTLKNDENNARRHVMEQDVSVIAQSLDEHGQQKPIIATRDGKVIAGNGTLMAARDVLGWSHIAVVRFDSEDAARQAAFAIVDNRSAELSSWDFDELAKAIDFIPDNLAGELGFSDRELAAIHALVDDHDSIVDEVTKKVEFTATVNTGDDGDGSDNTTKEITDLGEPTHKCPKCGFGFDA